jgi:MvdD-like protein with pre-ATP grasp domain
VALTILCVTTSTDEGGITSVGRELEARGAHWLRLDTDTFPTTLDLSHEPGGGAWSSIGGLREVAAVWYRRCHPARAVPAELDADVRRACVDASRIALEGVLDTLDAFHLDRRVDMQRADCKPAQLAVARSLGIEVPRTLVTNDPDAVRRFAARCPNGVVTKMLLPATFLPGADRTVYTNAVSAADLGDLDGLRLCPMIFQERIDKELELRVTVVGRRVFPAAFDPRGAGEAGLDWRRAQDGILDTMRPVALPDAVAERLCGMLDHYGLGYGSFDLAKTPDRRWLLFELNPAGEFHFIEHRLGLPIAATIADLLVSRAASRASS